MEIENIDEKIIEFYKDPKLGLSINNVYSNLNYAGHKVTLKKVNEVIHAMESYPKVHPYREQKDLCLTTVTGTMNDNQARYLKSIRVMLEEVI